MTISEALKADRLNRLALANNDRWMYWTGETGGVDEVPNKWAVRQWPLRATASERRHTEQLIITDSEEEAVGVLLNGI